MHRTRLALTALLIASTLTAVQGRAVRGATPSASPAHFTPARCPFTLGKGLTQPRDVQCGYLAVPESQTSSRTVHLALAIFKSHSPLRSADPLIYLQGGPGGAILSVLGNLITADNSKVIIGNHDLILVDQRGNGFSTPSLACGEATNATIKMLMHMTSVKDEVTEQQTALQQCHDRLVKEGIDLNAYNTQADAADIAAIGPALGYKQVNIYGVSYGSRLALTMMRLYPEHIRSVVLDGVLPPQANLLTQGVTDFSTSFSKLFASCQADSQCSTAFPHIDQTFAMLIARLNKEPARMTVAPPGGKPFTALISGDTLVSMVFSMLYATSLLPYVPAVIDATSTGNLKPIASLVAPLLLDTSVNYGTYYSVQCGEDAPYTSPAALQAAANKVPLAYRPTALALDGLSDYTTCGFWNVRPVSLAQKMPVGSDIPTLVLNGEYDPVTPPTLGALAAHTLFKSNSYTFPAVGHGSYLFGGDCPTLITATFIDDPLHVPNAQCIDTMSPLTFFIPGS